MVEDNTTQRESILPSERAKALKMQLEAIKHQGSRPGEEDKDAGKRSTQVVGDRNGMNYKQVQRYIRLTELVPDLQKMVDEKKLAFTPAVEISFIRPKNQRYIAVSIEGQQSSPSLSQAQKMRELDKDGKLNGDVIDGILSEEKKEDRGVIISTAELSKYFGKEVTPAKMKEQIMAMMADTNLLNKKAKTEELEALLEKYVPAVEDMRTKLKKYSRAYSELREENARLEKRLSSATEHGLRKKMEIQQKLGELEELRRTVEELPPEILNGAKRAAVNKVRER